MNTIYLFRKDHFSVHEKPKDSKMDKTYKKNKAILFGKSASSFWKIICTIFIQSALPVSKSSCEVNCESVVVVNNANIKNKVKEYIGSREGYLNCFNTSSVTDMIVLFYQKNNFNGDISCWDVSSVTVMEVITLFPAKF